MIPASQGLLRAQSEASSYSRGLVAGRSVATRAGKKGGSKKYPGAIEDIGVDFLKAPKLVLTDAERQRLDESPDSQFYSSARMMQHAEAEFVDAITSLYSSIIPAGAQVLELCASRHSHLPPQLQLGLMVGQGMNGQELAANSSLHQWFIQDLNLQPLLLEQLDSSFDFVVCVNGIQYLTQPETVISEACRVLRPGGSLVIAFGPHCFKEKAFAGWLSRDMEQRSQLLQSIVQANGFDKLVVLDSSSDNSNMQSTRAATGTAVSTTTAGTTAATAAAASTPAQDHSAAAAAAAAAAEAGGADRVEMRVLLASKPQFWSAGAAEADAAAGPVDMRPDNVQDWFTKPGLAGLAEAASQHTTTTSHNTTATPVNSSGAAGCKGSAAAESAAAPQQAPPKSQAAGSTDTTTSISSSSRHLTHTPISISTSGPIGNAAAHRNVVPSVPGAPDAYSVVNERLLEQWHAAYESLVSDAVELGIPRSVIPAVKPGASPAELQAAVQHLQDMMASFLSAGL